MACDNIARGLAGLASGYAEQARLSAATAKSSAETATTAAETAKSSTDKILTDVDDIKAYLGYTDTDIVGICIDYANKTFKRLAGAYGKAAGTDFNSFTMFGGRKRCNVADNGTIVAYYGDVGYAEDGSMGQVMVYQPKFYYKVVPLVVDKITNGIGYHLRKANYYVSTRAKTGFKLHPAFYDANGNEVDYILLSAFEGSIWDTSASAYILNDAQVMDNAADKFCSIAGAKPASGLTQNLTRPNVEQMAQNRGTGWHSTTIKTTSVNQLLMMIELGTMNTQTAIENGVISITDNAPYNCSSLTGSTASLGNKTGAATETINEIGGVNTTYNTNGNRSITYRGVENLWGNIWKLVYGVNIYANSTTGEHQAYVCSNFAFAESKKTDNYVGAGFTLSKTNGYISAMGYSETFDWLFMPSECTGTSNLPVGDYYYQTSATTNYKIALLGGGWTGGSSAGGFYWRVTGSVDGHDRSNGGRLVYVPTATV